MPAILVQAPENMEACHDDRAADEDVYLPLNTNRHEIRLLLVEPGAEDEMVRCSFQSSYLKEPDQPQYETISYVWGDATNRAIVRLGTRVMDVPASSDRVIRRLRYPDKTRTLWIDALCINQNDHVEKGSQVALMSEIYSNTTQNLVFLGDGDDTTSTALECVRKIVEDMRAETDNFANARTLMYTDERVLRVSEKPLSFNFTEYEIDAIILFYSSEWFQRLWVVQEASLAPSNMCHRGHHKCCLDDILRAASWLSYKMQSLPSVFYTPGSLAMADVGILQATNLLETCDRKIGGYHHDQRAAGFGRLVQDGRDRNTTDPKDHIFALLGLVSQFSSHSGIPPLLKPDYSKSTAAVFRDATIYAIWDSESLEILTCVQHRLGAPSIDDLPTWAPVFDQSYDNDVDPSYFRDNLFSACGNESVRLAEIQRSSGNQLVVVGFIINDARTMSSLLTYDVLDDMTDMDIYQALAQVFKIEGNTDHQWPRRLDLAMTLTAGCDHREQRWAGEEGEKAFNFYNEAATTKQIHDIDDLSSESTEEEQMASYFCQAMHDALVYRRLFFTKSGMLGLGPQTMSSGDSIAILYGYNVPVVLRQLDLTESKYEFVGACYMYGLMDGEAVHAHWEGGGRDVVFTLV